MALNAKQKLFVKEYLIDKNATRAAKGAGYSARTAGSMGHELLKKPEIKHAIEDGLWRQERTLELRAIELGVTKERWLQELARIAMADIRDIATVDADGRRVKVHDSAKWDKASSTAIKSISATKFGAKIEMHSKQSALDTLGRSYGWVKDETNLNLPDGIQVILTMPSNGSEALPEKTAIDLEGDESDGGGS